MIKALTVSTRRQPARRERRLPRPIRHFTHAQTELAVRAFAWILAGMDDEEVMGTIRKNGEEPIDADDTRVSINDFGPALLAFATRSLRSRAAIVAYTETLVETVGIVRKKEGWGRCAWELSEDFRADMKAAGEVKDEEKVTEGKVQKLTREEGDLLIKILAPIFGEEVPKLGDELPRPGSKPAEESEAKDTWLETLHARRRWEFIRDWNKGFPGVVIGDGRNAVMTSLMLVELMLTPKEWSAFQDEMKATRAEASGEPAPETDAEELSDEDGAEDEIEGPSAPAAASA